MNGLQQVSQDEKKLDGEGCQLNCQTVSEPVKTRSNPVESDKTGPDWVAIRQDYLTTMEPAHIVAARHGVTTTALYQQSRRGRWQRAAGPAVEKAKKAVQTAINRTVAQAVHAAQPAVTEAIRQWQERSLAVAAKAMGHVENKLSGELEVEELKTLVAAADGADRIGRRGLGLDKGDTGSPDGTPVRVQLGIRLDLLGGADGLASIGPVLDVQAEQSG